MTAAIAARGLTKDYGELRAVDDVSLEVACGEVFALLGPNGAGKTTLVEILEGFRRRSSGDVRVLGTDPERFGRADRARIGCVLQTGDTERRLTPREALTLWASYYPRPRTVDEVLDLIGLTESADTLTSRLSGGRRRRLEMGMAIIGNPELMFLDEPTTGFDPEARHATWGVIEGLKELGTTVCLTTHYMEEAERLADRVAIVKQGRVVVEGPPDSLGTERDPVITFTLPPGRTPGELPEALHALAHVRPSGATGDVRLSTGTPTAALAELAGWAVRCGVELERLTVQRPTLEDAYLALVSDGESA